MLRVGYIVFPPTVVRDPNTRELTGHHVETIREIARLAGWSVEFIETDWSTFPAGLAAHQFDVSIAPTFVTVPRAVAVAFTRPLFYAGNSAIVRNGDSRFGGLESLRRRGLRIAVTQGEAGHEYARANLDTTGLIVHPGSNQSLAFEDVRSGRADIALGDAYMTAQFARQHPNEVRDLFSASPYNLTPVSWAVRPSDHRLLVFLDNALDALDAQGRLTEFEQRAGAHWLHPTVTWELRR